MGSNHSRSSGSFVSAASTFSDKKIERLEWELKMKNDKQNKKKFNQLRKNPNREEQSKEFGQLVDVRASDPVRVKLGKNKKKKDAESQKRKERQMKRQSTLDKLNNNYFYKNFAANENEQEQIVEESDENSSEDEEEKAYKPREGRQSERSARISNRSKSAQSHLKVTDTGENYRSFSGMNQVGRLS